MKIKIAPVTVIAFAIISTLNTCHDYHLKKEPKIGKVLEEKIEELEKNLFSQPTEDFRVEINEETYKYKGK